MTPSVTPNESTPSPRQHGRALVLLGLVALGRAGCPGAGPVPASLAGEPVSLQLEGLAGAEWRLLPGVGPVLAGRLEAARQTAGGVLDEQAALAVRGVGPALAARWRALVQR